MIALAMSFALVISLCPEQSTGTIIHYMVFVDSLSEPVRREVNGV